MCQIELDNRPVLGSVNSPDALQRSSSEKRGRNLSSWFLKLGTGRLLIELMFGGRQFHRLLAVRANEELRGMSAGLWYRIWLGREHLHPPSGLLENLRPKEFSALEGWDGRLGTRPSLILYIYIDNFVAFMSTLDALEMHGL